MSAGAASQQAMQTAIEHLHELWRRCLYCLALLIVGGAAGYVFRQQIISFMQRPLHEQLYYTSPMGSFNFVMQVCLWVGFVLALPVIGYNLIRFIEPALPKRVRTRTVLSVLAISYLLALGGAAFAYYIVLPATLHFFNTIGGSNLQALISVDQYFSFVLVHVGIFAAIFQMPLILLFINHITPFGPGTLRKFRKFIFVGSFAISLVIPMSPDPLSQASLALPIIILYEISEFLIWMKNRKHHKFRPATDATRPVSAELKRIQPLQRESISKPMLVSKTVAANISVPKQVMDVQPLAKPSTATLQRRNFQQPLRQPAPQTGMRSRRGPQIISDMLT